MGTQSVPPRTAKLDTEQLGGRKRKVYFLSLVVEQDQRIGGHVPLYPVQTEKDCPAGSSDLSPLGGGILQNGAEKGHQGGEGWELVVRVPCVRLKHDPAPC